MRLCQLGGSIGAHKLHLPRGPCAAALVAAWNLLSRLLFPRAHAARLLCPLLVLFFLFGIPSVRLIFRTVNRQQKIGTTRRENDRPRTRIPTTDDERTGDQRHAVRKLCERLIVRSNRSLGSMTLQRLRASMSDLSASVRLQGVLASQLRPQRPPPRR
jgi:hypothetical protein